MLTSQQLQAAGLNDFEIQHALSAINLDYGAECVLPVGDGQRQLRCPAYPANCDYVRITTIIANQVVEVAYWVSDEWQDDPTTVMGAIIGALKTSA